MRVEGRFALSGSACVALALLILYAPLEWLLAGVLAGVVHELCHAGAVKLCGGKIPTLRVGACGAVMHAADLEGWRQPVCLLAGPAGGLLLLLFARWLPRTAICGLVHSVYNLFPGEQLDGGRALRWIAERFLPVAEAERLCLWIRRGFCAGLMALSLWAVWICRLGWMPFTVCLWLLYRLRSSRNA